MKHDRLIVEKISKLLALADGNQNEHEREVAMQFAMNLLAKHNLTIAEIQGAAQKTQVEQVDGDFRLEPWVRRVLKTACMLYYTDFYTSTRWEQWRTTSREIPVFVGTADNIAVTIEIASWLIHSIRMESNRIYKSAYERRSFRLGAANKLFLRAVDIVFEETVSPAAKTGSSLMVMRNQLERANQDFLATKNLRHTRQRRSYVHPRAYDDGEAFGDNVALNRGAKERSSKMLRLPSFSIQ